MMKENEKKIVEENVQEPQDQKDTPCDKKQSKAVSKLKEELEAARADLAKAQEELKASEEKVASGKDDYVRLMAEFDNYRRRTAQEKLDLVSVAAKDTIEGLLPVLDDCERALAALEQSSDSDAAKEGTQLIYNKLMGYLKSRGLSVIEAKGQPFDTDLHEAVAQFPVQEDEQKGKVFDVVQTGYTLSGKVIRYAKVVVGI